MMQWAPVCSILPPDKRRTAGGLITSSANHGIQPVSIIDIVTSGVWRISRGLYICARCDLPISRMHDSRVQLELIIKIDHGTYDTGYKK